MVGHTLITLLAHRLNHLKKINSTMMDTTIAHCCRRPLCAAAGPAVESQHKVTGVTFDFWRGENQERWLTRQRICCQSKKQNYLSGNMSGLNSAIIGNLITYWWKNSCYLPEKLEVCVLLPTSLHLQPTSLHLQPLLFFLYLIYSQIYIYIQSLLHNARYEILDVKY